MRDNSPSQTWHKKRARYRVLHDCLCFCGGRLQNTVRTGTHHKKKKTRGEEASGVTAMLRECTRATAVPQRQRHHGQRRTRKTATSSVVAIAIRMTIQLMTDRGKHTCIGLVAAQQPIQCKYKSTAYDKSAKIAASAWWHVAALRFKLAGVPAYLYKWRAPEAGETTKSPSKTTDTTPQRGAGGRIPWGGGGGGRAGARHHALHSPSAPEPAGRPCSQRSRTTGTNPRKPEGGRTMENDPSQCFFTGAENRIKAGTGHRLQGGNEHVTMTLLLTSSSNHTISL